MQEKEQGTWHIARKKNSKEIVKRTCRKRSKELGKRACRKSSKEEDKRAERKSNKGHAGKEARN